MQGQILDKLTRLSGWVADKTKAVLLDRQSPWTPVFAGIPRNLSRHDRQRNYLFYSYFRPILNSNSCFRRERAVSHAIRRVTFARVAHGSLEFWENTGRKYGYLARIKERMGFGRAFRKG